MDYNITYRKKNKGIQVIVSYKDSYGKWRQKSKQGFKMQRDAKRYSEKIIEELKATECLDTPIEFRDLTFKEFTEMHLKSMRLSLTQNTITGYNSTLLKFKALDSIELTAIKPFHIQDVVDSMIPSYSHGTIKVYLQRLGVFFNAAINHYDILSTSPVKNIKFKSSKSASTKRALTTSEADDLLSKIANKNYYCITLIAIKCGLRIGEILGLTWSDVDFSNETIKINKQWKLLNEGEFGFGTTKSKNSNRTVPMPPSVSKGLNNLKVRNINGRIFPYKNTTSIASDLRRLYARCSYPISVHELRHTYATSLISVGIDFKTIAQLMGHDIEQTLKTYSHVTDEMLQKASNLIKASL